MGAFFTKPMDVTPPAKCFLSKALNGLQAWEIAEAVQFISRQLALQAA